MHQVSNRRCYTDAPVGDLPFADFVCAGMVFRRLGMLIYPIQGEWLMTLKQIGRETLPYLLAAFCTALSAGFFLGLLDLMNQVIKLYSGGIAAAMVFGIAFAGIVELVLVITFMEYFRRIEDTTRLLDRFLLIVAIEGVALPVLEVGRLLLFRPVIARGVLPLSAIWDTRSRVFLIGGSLIFIIASLIKLLKNMGGRVHENHVHEV